MRQEEMTMLESKRKELEARRVRLQEQLRQEEAEAYLRPFFAQLDSAGVNYTVVEDHLLLEWVQSHFLPSSWNLIDWERVTQKRCLPLNQTPAIAPFAWLTELQNEEVLGDPLIWVLYKNARLPSLEIRFSEVIAHVDAVIDWSWDTWVFDQSSDWIIEYFHDGGWCWGRAAP